MAGHRMFSRLVTESDRFLDLSLSAQALYFHLGLNADDDGFVTSPRKIMRICGASGSDFAQLIDSGLVYTFEENGVLLIIDWLVNNQIRADRYHSTPYQREFSRLIVDKGQPYKLIANGNLLEPTCTPNDNQPHPQVNLSEANLSKDNSSKVSQPQTGKVVRETHSLEDDTEQLKKTFRKNNNL